MLIHSHAYEPLFFQQEFEELNNLSVNNAEYSMNNVEYPHGKAGS